MRIVHVVDYFQPGVGYQEYYLAREHARMGHTVSVVTCDRYRPFPDYEQVFLPVLGPRVVGSGRFLEGGVQVLRLRTIIEHQTTANRLVSGLVRRTLALQPDVIFCHDILNVDAWLLARSKNQFNCPLIFDNHASDYNTNLDNSFLKRTYHQFFRIAMRPAIRKAADRVIAIGEPERVLVCRELGLRPEAVPVIHLGADTDLFRPDPTTRRTERARLGVADDDVLFIHAGKLSREKDVHVLISALVPLLDHVAGVHLMIVGGGDASYIRHLRELASESGMARERIRFSPFVENAALTPLFQAADVGVWPGNHSQVMYEAIASGLPMVLPDRFSSYGTSDFLLANANGIAFPRGEVDKLRVSLGRLAANAELRREMGQRSRALAEREFSWPAIARRFVSVARVASDSSGASVPTAPSTDSC